jgi:hypothetical protein
MHDRLAETLRARQISLLEALIVIVCRARMAVTARVVLGTALDVAAEQAAQGEPTIPTVLRVLDDPTAERAAGAEATSTEFAFGAAA